MAQGPEKFILVGLDGTDWRLIRTFLETGAMPNIRRLMEEGTSGPLLSTPNPLSMPAWASMYSGLWPHNHGLLDGLYRRRGSYELCMTDGHRCRTKPLWSLLSQAERRVCAASLVNTYPPEGINGVMLSGLGAPAGADDVAFPAHIMEVLRSHVGEYRPPEPIHSLDGRRRPSAAIRALMDSLERRTEFFEYLLRRESWDFFACCYYEMGIAHQNLWHLWDPTHPWHPETASLPHRRFFEEFYAAVDRSLGRILEAAGPGYSIVIASQNGSGPLTRRVHVNRWLADHGFLKFLRSPGTLARRGYQRAGSRSRGLMTFEDVDWKRTRAYSCGVLCGGVFLNLKDREPDGIVEPGEEAEEVLEELGAKLSNWIDPETGKPILAHIFRREDFGKARFEDELQDLFLVPRDYSYFLAGYDEFPVRRWLEREEMYSGTARPSGIHILHGPSFTPGTWAAAEIVDLAPTILQLMDVKLPREMDGVVLEERLKPEVKEAQRGPRSRPGAKRPPKRQPYPVNQIELSL